MNSRAVAAVLVLFFTFPFVLLTVALPVGFVMEVGKQRAAVVENRTERPLRVTPLGRGRDSELRVLPRTWHALLPLPAFSTTDLDLAPGSTLPLVYSARQAVPVGVAVRETDGALGYVPWEQAPSSSVVIAGRPASADERTRRVVAEDSPAFRWAMLLAGPLGTLAFVAAWRARRRFSSVG